MQIPGLSDSEEALNTIGKTGKLEFARLDSFTDSDVKAKIQNGQYGMQGTVTDAFGNSFPSEKVEHLKVEEGTYTPIITGSNLEKVDVGQASQTSTDYAVNLRLDSEGTKAFAEATEDLAPTKGRSSSSLTARCSPRLPCSPSSPTATFPSLVAIRSTRPSR